MTLPTDHLPIQSLPPGEESDYFDADPRLRPALQLARMCGYEAGHSRHTTMLALRLFDDLCHLHGMGQEQRYWLQVGGLLHDIGWVEGGRSHHKTSLRIILTTPMLPFTSKERLIIGSIARYHRKSLPKQKHDNFASLSPDEQRQTAVLASFLRLADGLDFNHCNQVSDLSCQACDEKITIKLFARQSSDDIFVPAIAKSDLLKKVFGRKIELVWSPI